MNNKALFAILILATLSFSAYAHVNEPVSILKAFTELESTTSATNVLKQGATIPTLSDIASRQIVIWVVIIMVVVLFYSVMAIVYMDIDKEKDTILYAKFIRVDDRKM
eukprot:403371819